MGQGRGQGRRLNHHDVWSLRGVGLPADRLPMILGCDAAGVTADGRQVIVYAVINDPDFVGSDATYDPAARCCPSAIPGTLADPVRVPAGNLVDKPAELSFAEAACLPTAWLTAYRVLFTAAGLRPGDTVLVQGAGGEWPPRWWCSARRPGYGSGSPPATRPGRRGRSTSGAAPGVRLRRAAARARGRRDGDRRRGDLVALDQRPAAGRHAGDLRHHLGRRAARPS